MRRGETSPPAASMQAAPNRTTPTPSLNSASPSIRARMLGARLVRFSVASTPTGSVGLIRTPKTTAQGKDRGTPRHFATSQNPAPITAAEKITPRVASTATIQAYRLKASKSTCIAPANSKNASMKRRTAAEKSIWCRRTPTARPTPKPGAVLSTQTKARVANMPTINIAALVGSRRNLRFSQPIVALTPRKMAVKSNRDSVKIGGFARRRVRPVPKGSPFGSASR